MKSRALATGLLLVPAASAQNRAELPSQMRRGLYTSGRIVTQRDHDVDGRRTTIPPALQAACASPCGLEGAGNGLRLATGIAVLGEALGPGGAPAQLRINKMIDAGYARRGFLRGLQAARYCPR